MSELLSNKEPSKDKFFHKVSPFLSNHIENKAGSCNSNYDGKIVLPLTTRNMDKIQEQTLEKIQILSLR